jgi:hypothetical protein
MHDDQLEALDAWIMKQAEPMTRPEAIRQLIERGLQSGRK